MIKRQITSKQSRQARALLQWNVHDVVSKCSFRTQRFESFERGSIRLTGPENDQLMKVYTDNHIVFTSDYEVRLEKVISEKQRSKLDESQDVLEDVNILRQLEHGMHQQEDKIDVNEEMAKEFNDRVRHLVNLKENEAGSANASSNQPAPKPSRP